MSQLQPTVVSGDDSHKRKARSDDLETDDSAIAKRTRSTSSTRVISNEDILNAIRHSEERIVKQMQSLMESKISEVRSEFDAKLNAVSSSIDDRIRAALDVNGVAAVDKKCEEAISTIDAVTAMSDLRIESLERTQNLGDSFVQNEDICSYFKNICDAISFQRGLNAVSSVFRLPVKSYSSSASIVSSSMSNAPHIVAPPIIVKFLNSDLSRQFISSYLKFNQLNLTHLGFKTPSRIYINENLTKLNREIFRYCLQLKHSHKLILLKLFTRNGIVHAKFAGLDKFVLIHSKKEIDTYITRFTVEQH